MKRRDCLGIIPAFACGLMTSPAESAKTKRETGIYWQSYQEKVLAKLHRIHDTESDRLLEASYRIAQTYKNGGACWTSWDIGHCTTEDIFPGRHGDPGIMKPYISFDQLKKGDLLLINLFGDPIDDPRKKGVFVIGGQAPWCGETPDAEALLSSKHKNLKIRPFSDLWISTYLSTYGPEVWLPGAQYPMGAISGIVGMTTFWMMQADAVRLLAADGVKIDVRGDEPTLADTAGYVSLTEPLADHYFDELVAQLGRIDGEFGMVCAIAEKAVDVILDGGKVYVYSKFWEGLSIEANTRRGGLTCFYSVDSNRNKDYPGDGKDLVIMGIYAPDDPVDKDYYRKFRAAGSSIASIGPAERNKQYPKDSLPFQTDFHLGYMCDTYGLFAIPGVSKKVCPTSGALVNQMFYAVCFAMAERLIEETGNTPYIYPNAAIEGPPYAEFSRVHNAGRNRGY